MELARRWSAAAPAPTTHPPGRRSGCAAIPAPARWFGRGESASRPARGFRRRCVGGELNRFVAGHGQRGGGCGCRRRGLAPLAAVAVVPVEIAVDPKLLYAPGVGVEDFELERAGAGHQLAAHRHATDSRRNIAGKRIHLFGHLADVEFGADDGAEVIQAGASVCEERAVGLAHHAWRSVLVVLVGDIADDLLDDVLDRDDAVAAA